MGLYLAACVAFYLGPSKTLSLIEQGPTTSCRSVSFGIGCIFILGGDRALLSLCLLLLFPSTLAGYCIPVSF